MTPGGAASVTALGRRPARPAADPGVGDRTAGPGGALGLLLGAVVLYLAFGKGFAYAGWPPVFVGEVLLVAVAVAAGRSTPVLPRHPAALVVALVGALAIVQAAVDRLHPAVPLVETVRGLAPIYYAVYGFAAYSLLRSWERRSGRATVVAGTERAVRRAAPWVLAAVLLLAVLLLVEPTSLPTWPGSGVPLLLTKSGDIAVTLALLGPVLLASDRTSGRRAAPSRWRTALLAAWALTALLVSFRSRGALLALLVGTIVARPNAVRMAKVALAGLAVVLALYVSGLRVEVGGREISYGAVGDAVGSVLGGGPEDQIGSNYLDTTNWRADWWASIWDDVRAEGMVLHGRGWGDNLAVRHGVTAAVAGEDPRALRLPHDIFFSLVGRAGLVTAIGFLLVPVLTVARTFRRRGDAEPPPVVVQAARGAVAAAVATGLTDIYLESPQGGIVYWTLIGFLWWAVAAPLPAPPPPPQPPVAPA